MLDTHVRPALGHSVREHLGLHLRATFELAELTSLPPQHLDLVTRLEQTLSERENAALGEFTGGLLKALPNLRAFALSLHNNPHKADDLVQDTVVRAWEKRHTFETGTNLNAWLFTIMRNAFFSEHRKRFREVEDVDGIHASRQACGPTQMDGLETAALQRALACLSPEQREALLLVGGQGMSYDEAAAVCGTRVGTMKSRVNRARARLLLLMGYSSGSFASDPVLTSAIQK